MQRSFFYPAVECEGIVSQVFDAIEVFMKRVDEIIEFFGNNGGRDFQHGAFRFFDPLITDPLGFRIIVEFVPVVA